MSTEAPEPAPSIYLGADGQYHDDTEEMRAQYPAAEDAPAQADDAAAPADADQPVDAPAAEPSAKTRKA